MKKVLLILTPIALIVILVTVQYSRDTAADNQITVDLEKIKHGFLASYDVSEAISYKNLDIFMIYGDADMDDEEYVPLNEAMKHKWVDIIETSNVSELSVSNPSEHTVFIHSGDIVKGGRQDRTLAYDLIVDAGTRGMELPSFCVESDRWSQRGNEETGQFSENTKMLSSRDLKISSKKNKQQGSVWSEVSETQNKLTENVSAYYNKDVDVKATESASSLELALDNSDLKELQKEFKSELGSIELKNAVGFAYAINGELYNVDVYNNHKLFKQLFDKLVEAAIVEAITELDVEQEEFKSLSMEQLMKEVVMGEEAETKSEKLNDRTKWDVIEDEDRILFTSIDLQGEPTWLHHNLIIKGDSEIADIEVGSDRILNDILSY